MKKTAVFLGFVLLTAAPSFAQSQQFGLLLGGSKRIYSRNDKSDQPGLPSDSFKLSNAVREVWYGIQLEPGTMFKIKAGQIDGPVGSISPKGQPLTSPVKGRYEHLDGIIDYRFSEPFGSTGLFAGAGLYRAKANGQATNTEYGFSVGVNTDFPITRHFGVIGEGTYHWMNFAYRPRIVTLTGGLRISF